MVERTPTLLKFQWDSPNIPNGPIIDYTLTIDYNNGTNTTISVGTSFSYILTGLSPYQFIIANITASTIVGPGPSSTISMRTLESSK